MADNSKDNSKEYMTVPEMMIYLSISKKTAYALIKSGAIPAFRLSERKTLVKRVDVVKYISRHRL